MEKKVHKVINLRLPKELWLFIKHQSIREERSVNKIMCSYIEKDQKKFEKKLTENHTMV